MILIALKCYRQFIEVVLGIGRRSILTLVIIDEVSIPLYTKANEPFPI